MKEPRVLGLIYFGPNSDGQQWARGVVYECRNHNRHHAVEFRPAIGPPLRDDTEAAMRSQPIGGHASRIWNRVAGETPETITLSPSINWECCHAVIENGKVNP